MTRVAVIIPFRDRGRDPLRQANLERIELHWRHNFMAPLIVSDGGTGDEQFNRSAAYNRGIRHCGDADVFVFTESDMFVSPEQIRTAIIKARVAEGLVVPFTQYRYLSEHDSDRIRAGEIQPQDCTPQGVMDDGSSIGAINVVSRQTMDAVGQWDETFDGSWYDDDAMCRAFEVAAAPTRWVDGPAYHLYHLPGWRGSHLTAADRAATARNRRRLNLYRQASSAQRIRQLTAGV